MALHVEAVPSAGQLQHVAARLGDVCITVAHPAASLRRHAPPGVVYIDAITPLRGLDEPEDPSTRFVGSPTMLEALWIRTHEVLKTHHRADVTLHSLSALAVYNGPDEALTFARSLAERVEQLGGSLRVLVTDSVEGRRLREMLDVVVAC